MKYGILFLMTILTISASAQTIDSMAIHEVDSLILISRNFTAQRQYDQALKANTLAEKITLEKLGGASEAYGHCTFNRGRVNYFKGDYPEAEKWYLESKIIREKILGNLHPDYAWSVNNLGVLYYYMGEYQKAEPFYLEAKTIREKVLGKEHPDYAGTLVNMGILYLEMGNYEKAELYYLEAKNIDEKVLGKDHPYFASSLNNLAILYDEMDEYEKAEPLYLEAMAIRKKVLGKDHPTYAGSLNNLASLYWNMGNFEKAEPLYIEATNIIEKATGKDNIAYTQSLSSLAVLYKTMGNVEKAEPLYLEAKAIQEKIVGKQHPIYGSSLFNLAILYNDIANYKETEPLVHELSQVNQSLLQKAVRHLSEQELGSYLVKFSSSQDFALSVAHESDSEKLIATCYDNILFYKGFLLNSIAQLQRLANSDPSVAEKLNLLKTCESQLASQYAKPIKDRDSIVVSDLEVTTNDIEKDLARSVVGYDKSNRQVKWQEVHEALKPGEMAVEFIHYEYYNKKKTDSTLYVAILLLPGVSQPQFIPLFEEKEFDHLLNADKERKSDYVNELYAWADRGMVKLGQEKKSLYDLIWAKIEAAGLAGIKTVYYSPSGVLHRLNLGAIAIDDETILSDRYNLVALNSTRQLVIPSTVTTQAKDALLVGGVEFDVETNLPELDDQPLLASRSTTETITESSNQISAWSYLKWTAKEVERIANSLNTGGFEVGQLTGSGATEETIKAIGTEGPSPRIFHIATHGFFFPDPEIKNEEPGLEASESVFKNSDNPMIRSGLILAGGNYAWQHGRAVSPDKDDGILTAYEISQMNLANTELVVLSACETGLGDIKGNEGVYGLQRAFKIAGAKYLIMSLWQVPDRETMEFMTTFYTNWLGGKMSIPDAFRKTQREMRDRFFNPYSWAGFVLVE